MARITIEHDIPMPEFGECGTKFKYPCVLRQIGERFIDHSGYEVVVMKRKMKKKSVRYIVRWTI